MKINVPSHEEKSGIKKKKFRNFSGGIITGIVLFGLGSSRLFWQGMNKVEVYTWIALGFGVLSFGFLGVWFGSDFCKGIFGR